MTIQVLTSSTGSGSQYKLGANTDGIVLPSASIVSTDNLAIGLLNNGQSLSIYGTVFGTKGLQIGVDTTVYTNDVVMIGAGSTVGGAGYGISVLGGGNRIINYGDIVGNRGVGIDFDASDSPASAQNHFNNFGHISGGLTGLHVFGSAIFLKNYGSINGFLGYSVESGQYDDIIFNYGSLNGDVSLFSGNNTLINNGQVNGNCDTESDSDVITNRGIFTGYIHLSDGANSLTNRGTIMGEVSSLSGIDTIDNRGGTINGALATGDGNDSVNNRGGTIFGAITLGGGDDRFVPGSNTETVDGGTGVNTLDLLRQGSVTLALNDSLDMVGLPTGSTYVNFQNVIGSYAGANILVGDANDNTFTGGRAADSLSGGNGADTLIGNGGKDVLQGGAGIDTLTGGAGADTFVFTNDDGVNSGNNDTITDFSVLQKDKINLAAIDADTTLAGDQAFKFIADAAFTHHAGELRTSEEATADGLVNFLYGDTNGDGVADFAIKLLNDEVVTKADFIL